MARTSPGDVQRAAARRRRPTTRSPSTRSSPTSTRRHAGPLALGASEVLRILPVQRRSLERARRLRQHRTRRARPGLAVESGADRGRRGRDRLAAPDARPVRRLERRDSGHGIDEHARRAALRARARHQLQPGARRPAGRAARRSSSTRRRTATARSKRRRCSRASAATTCATSRSTTRAAMRPDALEDAIAADRAAGRVPCAVVATTGTTTTHGDRSDRGRSRRSRSGTASGCTSTRRWPARR